MSKSELKKDWLFGNSVVALTGAFILGMAWKPTAGEYTYPIINVTVSTDLDWFFIVVGAFLIFATFFFGLASIVPFLRNHAFGLAVVCSPILKIFVFAGFIFGLDDAIKRWPIDQWWTEYLFIVGIMFLPIILAGLFRDFHHWSSRDPFDSSKSAEAETSEEERRSDGLGLGVAIILLVILIGISRPALLRLWQRISSR